MADITPIEKTIEVGASPQHAFEFFTARLGDWWPVHSHSIGASVHDTPPDHVIMEPQVGGRIYEVMADGTEHDWGKIRVWAPHSRLVFSWQFHKPDSQATEVQVHFASVGNGRTRVDLTHRHWDNDPNGKELREGYQSGWDPVLASYKSGVAAD